MNSQGRNRTIHRRTRDSRRGAAGSSSPSTWASLTMNPVYLREQESVLFLWQFSVKKCRSGNRGNGKLFKGQAFVWPQLLAGKHSGSPVLLLVRGWGQGRPSGLPQGEDPAAGWPQGRDSGRFCLTQRKKGSFSSVVSRPRSVTCLLEEGRKAGKKPLPGPRLLPGPSRAAAGKPSSEQPQLRFAKAAFTRVDGGTLDAVATLTLSGIWRCPETKGSCCGSGVADVQRDIVARARACRRKRRGPRLLGKDWAGCTGDPALL